MKTLSVVVVALLCASCTTAPVRVQSVEPVKPPDHLPSAEALVECQRPGPLEDNSFGAVVRKLSETLGLLDECASKHQELSEFTRGQ